MKIFSKYNAPLTVPLVLIFGLVTLVVMGTWINVIVPHFSADLSSLEDSSPFWHSILQTLIRVMVLPVIGLSTFLMVHFYQRYYDRKKREHDAA